LATENIYTEITGITVATPALTAVQMISDTKNASSSAYYIEPQSLALIATSGTPSTPAGTDTPGYTWQWFPWMAEKGNTGGSTRNQGSGYLGGGTEFNTGNAQNDERHTDFWRDTGTYKVGIVYLSGPTYAIHNITGLNGTQTIDGYASPGGSNNYAEVTGISVAAAGVATFQDTAATRNGSATGWYIETHSYAVIRTGA